MAALPVIMLANRGLAFSLYEFYLEGVSVQELASVYALPVEWVEGKRPSNPSVQEDNLVLKLERTQRRRNWAEIGQCNLMDGNWATPRRR